MTRDQLARDYGSDPKAVQAIESFAKQHGLVVTSIEPTSARMGLAGTADNINTAFGVTLMDFENPKLGAFHARTSEVTVPPDVAGRDHRRFRTEQPPHAASGLPGRRTMSRRRRLRPIAPGSFRPSLRPSTISPPLTRSSNASACLSSAAAVETSDVASYFSRIGVTAPQCGT